jgi:DNA-binding LacI/PurR family transcriptional regulator
MDGLIDRFAALSPRPTGVFVGNDAMAAMCYRSMRQRQIEPRRDVEIVSCNNDTALLLGLDPRPATIDLGSELLGRRSFEQVVRSLRRPKESRPARIAISPQLIPGE